MLTIVCLNFVIPYTGYFSRRCNFCVFIVECMEYIRKVSSSLRVSLVGRVTVATMFAFGEMSINEKLLAAKNLTLENFSQYKGSWSC